ncbi:TRAP transporter small permease [Paracoccus sp. Z330]|uniref:TRAP transporter small permease protein n=1 Tax=Paracoccus onchidii TaxID=3017813 RepID=A0ABT4ZIU7_9RHOB|nr:TRAP transporter small permease [Paracoccus onchidii]MDB6179287.1 TRAP transporter small permease [Paracoccus onchidii]
MIGFLTIFDRIFTRALHALILATSLIVTVALVTLVVCRYVFNYPVAGMHELSMLAALWLYMAGAVLASRNNGHLVVDFLAGSLRSSRAKALHQLVVAALTLIIACFFALWVWKMLAWGMKRPQSIPLLQIPLWVAQLPFALAALSAMAYALRDMVRAALSLTRASKES